MSARQDIALYDGTTVRRLLEHSELEVIDVVREAYSLYGEGKCSLPHSTFLRFQSNPSNRIIGLPAYLGGRFDVAGMKWVASFPENIKQGLDRASATMTLNDTENGRPLAFMEASSINAHRTAASAAVAAQTLCKQIAPERFALVGCGYIGFEVANYLVTAFPSIRYVHLLDIARSRAEYLSVRLSAKHPSLVIDLACDIEQLGEKGGEIVCLATSAGSPWISERAGFDPGTLVLHISLRDISPAVLLECNNVVDDIDHVCRENTSVHLAEVATGGRAFIDAELPALVNGSRSFSQAPGKPTIFSPFGLGVLDIAVGKWLMQKAQRSGDGQVLTNFFPSPWSHNSTEAAHEQH